MTFTSRQNLIICVLAIGEIYDDRKCYALLDPLIPLRHQRFYEPFNDLIGKNI